MSKCKTPVNVQEPTWFREETKETFVAAGGNNNNMMLVQIVRPCTTSREPVRPCMAVTWLL